MIKIALCDDNIDEMRHTAKLLESAIINNCLNAEIIIITSNQDEIYTKIKHHEIDVLFLDIEFKNVGINGIEFAKKLRSVNNNFCLVFITGQFEYSLLAYQCKTFAYMLKPLILDKVDQIIYRLKEEYTLCGNQTFLKLNKNDTIRIDEIVYIERNKGKTKIHTDDDMFFTNFSLNVLIEKLPKSFKRVHRSYIVNTDKITKTSREHNLIYFKDKSCCPLGSNKITI